MSSFSEAAEAREDREEQDSFSSIDEDHEIALQRHVSLEELNPVHECSSRKSSLLVAIINLVATTTGGGVLSLPLAFKRAGIIPTLAFMVYGAVSTHFSLYILVSCGRRTGGRSYGDVAKFAFGNAAEFMTTGLLALMLVGSTTAYLVLIKDIWTPVILAFLPMGIKQPLLWKNPPPEYAAFDPALLPSKEGTNFVLLMILLVGSPLLLKRDLHALRHTCYFGFFSCVLLMIAVLLRAYEILQTDAADRPPLNWYSTNIADYAFAFPIVVLSFFCSYNILGVHASLRDPTRHRLKLVLDTSMTVCMILFTLVGLAGYLFALDETRDNILLNFPMHDKAILFGRVGFCFTLLFGLPLVILPCRDAWRELPGQIRSWQANTAAAKDYSNVDKSREEGAHLVINGVDFDAAKPHMVTDDPEKQHVTMLTYGATGTNDMEHIVGAANDETTENSSSDEGRDLLPSNSAEMDSTFSWFDQVVHVGLTFFLVGMCYTFAISVPGVGFVWSLAGSSMAIIIAFIIPATCYLKIRHHKAMNPRSIGAWCLLILSCIAAPICTANAMGFL